MEAEAETREELRSRRISTEDMVRLLLADINHLRSDVTNPNRVLAWSEAVEALADLLLPWAEEDTAFKPEWENRPCRVVRVKHPSGDPAKDFFVPAPTAADCREAQRIIMGLLNRSQLLVKRRTISGPGQKVQKPAQDGEEVPEDPDDSQALVGVL